VRPHGSVHLLETAVPLCGIDQEARRATCKDRPLHSSRFDSAFLHSFFPTRPMGIPGRVLAFRAPDARASARGGLGKQSIAL